MAKPIAVRRDQTWEYVLQANREDPEEDQVVFVLGPPSAAQAADIWAAVEIVEAGKIRFTGKAALRAFRAGLREVRGLTDQSGSPVKIIRADGFVLPELVDLFADRDINEVGTEVITRSLMAETERGK